MGVLVERWLHFKLFLLGQPKHISFFLFNSPYSNYIQENHPIFYNMDYFIIKLAGLALCFFYFFCRLCFYEVTSFGSVPVSVLLCVHVNLLLWLSVIFRHKGAHLKRPNANFISYMKQSWFIFTKLIFPCLQTAALHSFPCRLAPRLAAAVVRNRRALCGWYHGPRAPKRPTTHSRTHASPLHPTHTPFYSQYIPTVGVQPSPNIQKQRILS